MRKILDRVTVTGADNSVSRENMHEIQKRFPFVEWAILLSKSSEGNRSRFPSLEWMCNLVISDNALGFNLSGHLCGKWIEDIVKGNWTFFEDRPQICGYFPRLQLNFHGQRRIKPTNEKKMKKFVDGLQHHMIVDRTFTPNPQLIFQLDGVNNNLFTAARCVENVDAVGFWDTSHGVGQSPESWPTAYDNFLLKEAGLSTYQGYAGGLGPDNLQEQLERISEVCGDGPIWIDAETKLRSDDDQQFELEKVWQFLEIAEPWVI